MLSVIINAYYSAKRQLTINQLPFLNIIPRIVFKQEKLQNSSYQALKKCLRIAIEHLNHPKIEHRLAAIYDLEQFAHNYPQHHWKIMEILANFVRNNTPDISQEQYKNQQSFTTCTDIQLALTVIARRDTHKDPENEQLDLSHTDLRGANLNEANLEQANLYQVNLSGANLAGANFSGAILSAANLSGANLAGTRLCSANLYLANLCDANLHDAILEGANLREAKL